MEGRSSYVQSDLPVQALAAKHRLLQRVGLTAAGSPRSYRGGGPARHMPAVQVSGMPTARGAHSSQYLGDESQQLEQQAPQPAVQSRHGHVPAGMLSRRLWGLPALAWAGAVSAILSLLLQPGPLGRACRVVFGALSPSLALPSMLTAHTVQPDVVRTLRLLMSSGCGCRAANTIQPREPAVDQACGCLGRYLPAVCRGNKPSRLLESEVSEKAAAWW